MQSDDASAKLLGAQTLVDRHNLLEADVSIIEERMRRLVASARAFKQPISGTGVPGLDGFQPADPEIIDDHTEALETALRCSSRSLFYSNHPCNLLCLTTALM